jgi:hypothetical protein
MSNPHDQHRGFGIIQHVLGHTARYQVPKPLVTVSEEYNQVGFGFLGVVNHAFVHAFGVT